MQRFGFAFVVLLMLTAPASAKIGEAELSGSYVDTEDGGEIASVTGGVYAPMFSRFLIGPAGRFSYLDAGDSRTGFAGGVVLEYHVTKNETGLIPFLRAEGFKWFGDLENILDYQYSAGGGFKVGDDATAFKFTMVRTWVTGTDTQRNEARLGIVWRL